MDRNATAADRAGAEPPGSPADEAILTDIWAEVLDLPVVGSESDFFELGGDSLSATQVISRVRERFRVELPFRAFFEAPTIAGLGRALREATRQTAPAREPAAVALGREQARFPASFAQQRLWFLDQWVTRREVYNVHRVVHLDGPLDADRLRQALDALVVRHESLRTTFAEENGEPLQVIAPPFPVGIPVTDLSGLPDAERRAEADRLARTEASRPFDLAAGPLWRVHLLRLGEREHRLLLVMHHTISDGWTVGVFYRDLAAAYQALADGRPANLPPLAVQYADYGHWQRERMTGERWQAQLAYWKKQLAAPLATLQLPLGKPRPPAQTFTGTVHRFDLPAGVPAALTELARQENGTPYMAYLAAFQALLHRLSGQDDIVVGTPVANRNQAESEPLIGCLVNTLVLRTQCGGPLTFRDLLRRVRETTLAAYANQDLPFEKLVEELRPPRDPSRQPLFQVMFVFQNMDVQAPPFAGITLRQELTHNGTAMFDLRLVIEDDPRGPWAWVEANTDLYDPDTLRRIADHYGQLLKYLVAFPDQPLGDLPLLSPAERHRILHEWNDTRTDFPGDRCMHQLVEEQVRRTPDAVAVIDAAETLTYRELNARANRLAHYLREQGVGPGDFVGVCMRRSPAMLAAVLAVVKAGGAYVPLDPSYPKDRLAYMMDDTRAPLLLTERAVLPALPATAARAVCVDEIADALARQSDADPVRETSPDERAYVIYTSGSSGRPKGVILRHRPVVNLIDWVNRTFAVGPGDRLLFVASLNFDLSVYDIFGTLAAGAAVHIAREDDLRDPERLLRLLAGAGITFWDSAPAQLQQLAGFFPSVADAARSSPLRLVFLSGDWIPVPLPDQVRQTFPKARVIALGGATEAAIWSNFYPIGEVDPKWPSIPYGKPIQNARYHILDDRLNPVPVGVPAELHIGGLCLADGYLNQPELTAEKFVPDPHAPAWVGPDAKLYRTGDLARYFPDGTIEFLGRIDSQVKVRGFRIELGEIEVVLGQHPAVREAVVLARGARADRTLVAYVVPRPGTAPTPAELTAFLHEKLPAYMVPSHFVFLGAFPLSPNGKLDRSALPEPDLSRAEGGDAFVPPRTPTEEQLAAIFAEVLGVARVGADDDFFALGGHSLKATQAVTRVRERLKVDLAIPAFFAAPTVARLAELIGRTDRSRSAADEAIRPLTGDRTRVPASFAQQRLWYLDQIIPRRETYNVCDALRLRGSLSVDALREAWRGVVARHESLRTTFAADEGLPVQAIAPPPEAVELPILDLSGRPPAEREAEAERLQRAERGQPFDLAAGPLWRARLLRLSADNHVLLLCLHHIVTDEWSQEVLFRDLWALYAAALTGTPAALPALPVQYADFGEWQRRWLEGERTEAQLAYWKERLADLATLQLPLTKPRPPVQTFNGSLARFELTPELSAALAELARREGVTAFMLFLAAFQALLHRLSGQDDIVVGAPAANRGHAEVENVVGFFVNTLVMRADCGDDPTFRELLRRAREATLEAAVNQDVPFEKLVEELRPPRDPSRNPLFQVVFAYQEAMACPGPVPGLGWRIAPYESTTAKFDLMLIVENRPGRVGLAFEYNTDLFDRNAIDRLGTYLRTLLEGVAADPARRLSRLPLLSAAERHQLLVEWNATRADYPRDKTLHQLVEEQAQRTPHRPAVRGGANEISYAELNSRANQLAHHLRALGVGPDVPVGLCVERSIDSVVGMLGILKAGGAYLPLDPSFPAERLAFYVQDSGVRALVAHRHLLALLPAVEAVVCLDGDRDAIGRQPATNPPAKADPTNLVYIIYTSGSTGRPNGAQVTHRGLINLMWANRKRPGLTERDLSLAVSTLSFDIHTVEIWLPLMVGARVEMVGRDVAADAYRLTQRLSESGATLMAVTPATTRLLLTAGWKGNPKLKLVLGGESIPAELARQLIERTGEVWNVYGATEASVYTTDSLVRDRDRAAPAGRPQANTTVYILDRHLQPVPVGATGEVYLGGAGVGRGYRNRPGLTAERFVPDPFGVPGTRLYKTGDLGRYLPDGNLEFVGRVDFQVKVRGFRIELGEIEAHLARHPGVRQAVVVARPDESGSMGLVAYLVSSAGGTGPAPAELREYLRAHVPDYMIPAYFVSLPVFPLSPTGKVERRALPVPGADAHGPGRPIEAPRNDVEKVLLGIWETVLRRHPISTTDDFHDLGGHSLLAAVLMARIAQQLGQALPLGTLYAAPTVQKLAAVLQRKLEAGSAQVLIPWNEQGDGPPLFLIAGAGGHLFTFLRLARLLGPDQPVYGFKAIGVDGGEEPLDRIEAIAERYIAELLAARPKGPYLVGGYSVGGRIAFEMALRLHDRGHEVAGILIFDAAAPGYPQALSLPRRLWLHARNFLRQDWRAKRDYLRERGLRLKQRVYRRLGLGQYVSPAIEGVEVLSQDALRRVWAALYQAGMRYRPARAWEEDIVLFRAAEPPTWIAEWTTTKVIDPFLGWGRWVRGAVKTLFIPGAHLDMFQESNLELLADHIRQIAAEVEAPDSESDEPPSEPPSDRPAPTLQDA